MNPLEGLAHYLDRLEKRLRIVTWSRGAAMVAGAALLLTLAIVAALMGAAFSPASLLFGRFVLFLGIALAVALTLIVPLMRMNRRRAAQEVEQKHPGFDQRLLTFTERSRDNAADPFLPLLAADALQVARNAEPEQVVQNGRILRFASVAAVAASALIWLIFSGVGVLGYGSAILWGNYPKDQVKPLYSISVEPGSKTIRRKSDQLISAQLSGFTSQKASVFVRYASAARWEEAPMEALNGNAGFGFTLVGIPEDVDYYVSAGGIKSSTFKLHTVDLPAVKNIKVTYAYPSWAGMASVTEDPGGDLRAVEGTVAKLEIQTDRPLNGAQILFDDGKPLDLTATENNKTTASVTIQKDGSYHLAVSDHGEMVRLTDDYFIEARKVSPPTIRISKPGRDAKVSPIEEVEVSVSAEDEYPLQELSLHYSVNGAAEKVLSLLKDRGAKKTDASTLLSMEDFKLVPGDIVSIYATAKDGKNSAKTDMFFIQAVPFEFNYTQSQQAGGGGGGGGGDQNQQQISERQKEIIAATFNQIKADPKAKTAAAENGKYLADVQAKLRDQAQSLANRTKARQLDSNGAGFSSFVKEMELAVAAMTPASDKLKALSFQDALTPEQQALQHLLRAESTFRDIQVQISRNGGGGGGGGGGGAGRDLANLFDLELDKDKNQYETNSSAQSSAERQQQAVDDAMKKLADLARRQQELAQQQRNNPQQMAQQRWQQEMLRREAEQLRRDMEQMQRGEQQGQQQSGQQQQGQQSGQQGQGQQQSASSGSGQQSGQQQSGQQSRQQQGQQQQQQQMARGPMTRQQQQSQQQLEEAIRQIEQATRDMSSAASARQSGQQQNGGAQSEAQRAADRLRQAGQTIQSMRNAQTGTQMGDLARKAEQLAGEQQDFEQRLRRNFGQGEGSPETARQMADEKKQMHAAYDDLQKQMQQAARSLSGTSPDASKKLREASGKGQQDEVGNRMDFTESALRQGMGSYAVMREAPVTRSLNELKDDLKKLEAEAGTQNIGDDKAQQAMQQALNQAEQVRRAIQQLGRHAQGQQNGRQAQQGQGQQQARNGQQGQGRQGQGQAQGQGQQGQQGQGQQGQQGQGQGQQGQGQQGQGGQGGQGQQAGNSPSGSPGNQGGGGGFNRNGQRMGGQTAGGNNGSLSGPSFEGGTAQMPSGPAVDPQNVPQSAAQREASYGELMKELARLRSSIGDDKDLTRQYQDLVRQAQQLDPKRSGVNAQLAEVINGQVMNAIDQVELLLRRKINASDGSVRSANPHDAPPGYAEALREYYKRLSK